MRKKPSQRAPQKSRAPRLTKQNYAALLGVAVISWVVTAFFAFNVRHPWATDMEMWMQLPSVLTFQKVPYDQMRPR